MNSESALWSNLAGFRLNRSMGFIKRTIGSTNLPTCRLVKSLGKHSGHSIRWQTSGEAVGEYYLHSGVVWFLIKASLFNKTNVRVLNATNRFRPIRSLPSAHSLGGVSYRRLSRTRFLKQILIGTVNSAAALQRPPRESQTLR